MAELSDSNKSDKTSDDKSNNINDDKGDDKSNDKSSDKSDDKSHNINDNKSDNINDCDRRETIRRQFYKNRIRKDNIKLELDDSTPQEERRRLLLEYQKQYRDKTFNAARGISQEYSKPENEEYIDTEDVDEESMYMIYTGEKYGEVSMEVEECISSWHYRIDPKEVKEEKGEKRKKTERMMLSEWMLDVPQDLTEKWIMVPCPIGKRVRLISGWGETRAYSRKGILHGIFPSALPGGNPNSDSHNSAAVDCIWVKSRKLFYILDVLYWSLLPITNCEAEFRLFWIKNKLQEIPEFKERGTDTNKFPILTLQNINCNSDLSLALSSLEDELHPLDGFLFYHREALYTYGSTPLVTWLKPFMLSEVLGIYVPSPLDDKPNDYISFEHHMHKIKAKKNNQDTRIVTNPMEIEGV